MMGVFTPAAERRQAVGGTTFWFAPLLAGGLGKGQDFTPLKEVAAAKARAVVLMGRDAPLIELALADAVPVIHVTSMEDDVQRAAALAQPGDTVLQ